jgi:Galactose oxidase, central domain
MRIALGLSLLTLLAAPSAVVPTGSMSTPRAAHSATLLRSGEVLIVGGCAVDGCELDDRAAQTELFNPQTGRFRSGPRLLRPRVGHVAIRLPDGRVLIAGGWTGNEPTASTELYDPARNVFIAGPWMTSPRGGFAVAPLRQGRFLFAGGTNGNRVVASAEIFDAATQRFTRTGGMRTPRSAHVATPLGGGRVLVTGGSDRSNAVLATTEVFRRGRFVRGAPMRVPRYKHAAVPLRGGGALVVGGSDRRDFLGRYASVERYDGKRFRLGRRMAERRFKLPDAVVGLPSGLIVVAGGGASVEVYDQRLQRFKVAGRVAKTLAFATATALADGRVLVAGGYDDRIDVSAAAWLVSP